MQLKKVKHVVELSKNDSLPLDYASQLCNSDILSRCTHFIAFAFHDSDVMYVGRWAADVAVAAVLRCAFSAGMECWTGWRYLEALIPLPRVRPSADLVTLCLVVFLWPVVSAHGLATGSLESAREAKALGKVATLMYLD